MIPVREQPEPPDFDIKVRNSGDAFLRRVPHPTSQQFNRERHWRNAVPDLYRAYNGLCAYSAIWIPRDITRETVDHYIPKAIAPKLAYEWSNFRLASEKLNQYKGDSLDVMDPFAIEYAWFTLSFPSCLIKPNPALPAYLKISIDATIKCLKLNDDDNCVQERLNWLLAYCEEDVSMNFLKRRCPFIAYELKRQNLEERIKTMLRRPTP